MTDNVRVNPGEKATAITVATDEVGGVHYPVYKLAYSSKDSVPVHVSLSNPFPVATTSATTAYGELSVEQNVPEVQMSAQYNTSRNAFLFSQGGGSSAVTGGEYCAASGTSVGGFGAVFSDRQVIAHPGVSVLARISARFPSSAIGNRSLAGLTQATDLMVFGYEDDQFGLFYSHDGALDVRELQVTTPAAGAENATVTIGGVPYTVPLTAGTVEHNAYEIAQSLSGQEFTRLYDSVGDTVVSRSIFAGPIVTSFAFSSATAVAAWSQIAVGVTTTDEFVAQADWNVDTKSDLDPTKINNYAIVFNGDIEYYIQDRTTRKYILVHTFNLPNTKTTPIFSLATFRLTWLSTNTGGTTNVEIYGPGGSAFIQGIETSVEDDFGAQSSAVGIGSTLTSILTIQCRQVYGDKGNLGRIVPKVVTASTDSGKGAIIKIIKNPVFAGTQLFKYQNKENSIALWHGENLAVTDGTVVAALTEGPSGSVTLTQNDVGTTVTPGETFCIAMAVTSGAASEMNASITWEEDV